MRQFVLRWWNARQLRSKAPDKRRQAALSLGRGPMATNRVITLLLKALNDPLYSVREAAAKTLGKTRNNQAVPALVKALKDEDRGVRQVAANSLGAIGDLSVIDPLIEALEDPFYGVRRAAAEALSEIANPSTVEAMVATLKTADPPPSNRIAERVQAAQVAIPALVTALDDEDPDVVKAAMETLSHLDPEGIHIAEVKIQQLGNGSWPSMPSSGFSTPS